MQYNEQTALEALGLSSKKELARVLDCHVQSLYNKKGGDLPARLNKLVNVLAENRKLQKKLDDALRIIDTKNEIIKALR